MKRMVLIGLVLMLGCTPVEDPEDDTTSSGGSGGSNGSGGSETSSSGGSSGGSQATGGSAGEVSTEGSSDSGGSAGESSTGGSAGEGGDSGSETSIGGMGGSSTEGSSSGGSSTGGSGGTGGLAEVGPDGLIVKQLAVGFGFACALTVRGGVKCWGENSYGTLGSSANTIVATDIAGLTSGVEAIAASAAFFHVCALKDDGSVVCWGANTQKQLDIDDEEDGSTVPVPLKGYVGPASGLGLGDSHWCFVDRDTGGLQCLGNNNNYRVGVEAPELVTEAVPVTGAITGYQQVAAGATNSCGLLKNGGIKCWGRNVTGALGNGYTGDSLYTATAVLGYGPDDTAATEISVGTNFACARDTEGAIKCWGNNDDICLGCPATVSGISTGATALASGMLHSCAVVSGGAVLCWGDNTYGQLGNGDYSTPGEPGAATPVAAAGIENALAVGAGRANTCVSLKTGGVKCWGSNWTAGSLESGNVLTPNTIGGFED